MFERVLNALALAACASLVIAGTASAQIYSEDFSGFAGLGFAPSPTGGDLDSDQWIATGMSSGTMEFGDTATDDDFARGLSSGGVNTGGVYAFDVGGADIALGVQPGSEDFTPGAFVVRIENTTGSTITQLNISYEVWVFNDQPRAQGIELRVGVDGGGPSFVAGSTMSTPLDPDGSPSWQMTPFSVSASTSVAAGATFELHFHSDDSAGGGSRDEIAFDDIIVAAVTGVPVCGNGTAESGEACDDGNTTTESECPYGIASCVACNADCTSALNLSGRVCGDGTTDDAFDEQCDDGNTVPLDGCDEHCQLESCGNEALDPGEECDDGNRISGDGCNEDCQTEECGDGLIQAGLGEQCDDGAANSDTAPDACRTSCRLPACGDGVLDSGDECDDGNNTSGDGCSNACAAEFCGDDVTQPGLGEECDDGDDNSDTTPDACRESCSLPACGDSVHDSDEACDDGNAEDEAACVYGVESCAACNAACDAELSLVGGRCGDGILHDSDGEACDDGNTDDETACIYGVASCTGCSADCSNSVELTGSFCGDGTLNGTFGEQCDDGNDAQGDGCSPLCLLETGECGDGTVDDEESCDDGNTETEDECEYGDEGGCQSCSSDCSEAVALPARFCGDGVLEDSEGEECDSGEENGVDGSGCNEDCTIADVGGDPGGDVGTDAGDDVGVGADSGGDTGQDIVTDGSLIEEDADDSDARRRQPDSGCSVGASNSSSGGLGLLAWFACVLVIAGRRRGR